MKKKNIIIVAVVSIATSMLGLEPSDLVRLYRDSFTNDVASRELTELMTKRRDLVSEAMSRMNGLELMLMYGVIDSVSVNSTNLTVTFRDMDALTLTPDKEATVVQHRQGGLFVTPVSFKDKGMGFQVKDSFAHMADERLNVAYVALSDTPTEVSEKDVEMIMKDGEWKTAEEYRAIVERENRLQELRFKYQDKRREAKELLQGEELTNRLSALEREVRLERDRIESGEQAKVTYPPRPPRPPAVTPPEPNEVPDVVAEDETTVIVTGDEPSEEKSSINIFFLYALIPLCLLAVLWVVKRKRKRDSP